MHDLTHALKHSLEDTLLLIPFLILTYLAMEFLETKSQEKTLDMLSKTGKKGPIIGGILGIIPQCGFSAASANLYSGGVITVGAMVAVFLSTSDEMLPILISGKAEVSEIIFILLGKIIVGIFAGLLIDLIARKFHKGKQKGLNIQELCKRDNCRCEEGGILKAALIHSIKIALFIFLILLAVNIFTEWVGMDKIIGLTAGYPVLSVFITALFGMIPNCAISVAITTLYLENVLTFGSMFAGLLSCSGLGLLILFRTNKNLKTNLFILGFIYFISVAFGILFEFIF